MTIAAERGNPRRTTLPLRSVAARAFGTVPADVTAGLYAKGLDVDAMPPRDARRGVILVDGSSIRRTASWLHFDILDRPTRALRNVVVSSLTDLVLETDIDHVLVVCTAAAEPGEQAIFRHWFGQVCADCWYELRMSSGLPAPSIIAKQFSVDATCDRIVTAVTEWATSGRS